MTFELAAHTLQRALPAYRIVREIGAGSMGTVFEAVDTNLNRRVAIKVLPPSTSQNDTRRLRFKREVEAIARVTHPNIVPIYTVGTASGLQYFVMGFVPGGSLADQLRSHGAYPALKAFRMMRQIVLAIGEAHRLGVIHRDIKPGNLLVDTDDKLILSDFGLARPEGTETMTETGAIVGTPMYMAPEQILGEKSKIDARCDLYAIGATLYQMLTASMPFHGESTTAILRAVLEKPPLPFARSQKSVPRDAQKIVLKLLHKDPNDRYADAGALLRDIDHLLDGEPVEATLPGVVTHVRRSIKRHPIATSIVIGVAILAGILLFGQNQRLEGRMQEYQRSSNEEMQRLRYDAELTRLSENARAIESDVGATWTYAGKIDGAISKTLNFFDTPEAQHLFDLNTELSPEDAKARSAIVARIHPFLSALFYYRALSGDARAGDLDHAQRICAQGLALAPGELALDLQAKRVEFSRSMAAIRSPGDAMRVYALVNEASRLKSSAISAPAYRAFSLELSTLLAEGMLEKSNVEVASAQLARESAFDALESVINETSEEAASPMQADPLILRERARALFASARRMDGQSLRRQREAEQLIDLVRDRLIGEPHTQALRARILEKSGSTAAQFLSIGAGVATQIGGSALEVGAGATSGLIGVVERLFPKLQKRDEPPSPPPPKKDGGN